jgi:hypothetical protein
MTKSTFSRVAVLLCAVVAVAFLLGTPASAQTALTVTTLSNAITSAGQTAITVTSATNISAPGATGGNVAIPASGGSLLFIEDGTSGGLGTAEAMLVTGVTGTTVTVVRGAASTVASPHLSGAIVFVGRPDQFFAVEPAGSCTPANTLVTPYINVRTGNQWLCSTVTNSWVPGYFNTAGVSGVTTAVASVAGATNPSGPLFHVTGTNAITAWGTSTSAGLGSGGGSATSIIGAPFCVIPDAIFTTTATNNIALASTAVVNKILCFTFDQTNKKYVPSY